MDPVIQIANLSHYFGSGALRRQILFDISTGVYPGEIVILTGPSGSGKTTLLTLVGALRSVEEGSVRVLGRELHGASRKEMVAAREEIGFIFQHQNLIEALTACANVEMALGIEGKQSAADSQQRAAEMLAAVGLSNFSDSYPRKLSGGQKQRVAIARALVRRPKIILADEPTAALDRKSGREVVELLHTLAKSQGCTILLVTHDNRILDIADRILTLEDGRLSSFTAGLTANTGHLLAAFAKLSREGELSRYVSRLPDKQFLDLLEQMTVEFDQFLRSMDVKNQAAVDALFDEMLQAVTLKLRDLLHADRGTIFLLDRERGMLVSRIAHGDGGKPLQIEIPISHGIAGRVASVGEALNISDPYHDPAFDPEVDRQTGYHTRSILCVPIFDRSKKIFAVGQFLNKNGGEQFSAQDLHLFRESAEPLGLILESCLRLTRQVGTPLPS